MVRPFRYVGALPDRPVGGEEVEAIDPDDGKTYRYHIFREPGNHFIEWYNLDVPTEVMVVGGGSDGQDSSYTAFGLGGEPGEYKTGGEQVDATYKILTLQVGDSGDSFINLPGGRVAGSGGSGQLPGDDKIPYTLPSGFAGALGVSEVGGSGQDDAGPIDAVNYGGGGAGGFKLLEPYAQQSYTHNWTTGGPYDYDCSYGARAEQYQSGTNTVTGDQRPCNACPPTVNGHPTVCHGPCDCNFAYFDSNGTAHWSSRGQAGCPGGWHECGCNCCTTQPVYSTRYHCDNGGSLSGSTCAKTCHGDNTQHHSETRWTDCNAGMSPDSDQMCRDVRDAGFGLGHSGVVVLRYEITPTTRTTGTPSLVGMPGVPTIY